MQQANVFICDTYAGVLSETDSGYSFEYDEVYLQQPHAEAISLQRLFHCGSRASTKVFCPNLCNQHTRN